MKKLFVFYLKNFRAIHHIVFIVMTFGFLKLTSFIFSPLNLIFNFDSFGLFLQLVTLAFCFYYNEKALHKVGLTDEFMNSELEKFKQKKR
jgi:hypothetical protein